jgi:hypothetical protein
MHASSIRIARRKTERAGVDGADPLHDTVSRVDMRKAFPRPVAT